MKLFLLLSVQAAAAPAPAVKVQPIHFDLARVKPIDPALGCGPAQGSEIVVCARRKPYVYPLDKMAKIYEPKALRAEKEIGGGAKAGVHVEQGELPNGMKSNRIMIGFKLPF
jgi:hypothetical protein